MVHVSLQDLKEVSLPGRPVKRILIRRRFPFRSIGSDYQVSDIFNQQYLISKVLVL